MPEHRLLAVMASQRVANAPDDTAADNPKAVIPGCTRRRPGISRFRVRCFASPRNDGVLIEYAFAFPRRDTPGSCKNSPPRRVWGMPGAQRTRGRACRIGSTRVSHHGRTGTPGIPARDGFNGFLRTLPGDRLSN